MSLGRVVLFASEFGVPVKTFIKITAAVVVAVASSAFAAGSAWGSRRERKKQKEHETASRRGISG